MIRYYERLEGRLVSIPEFKPHSLVMVVGPTPEEMAALSQRFALDPDFIMDSLDVEERSRFEVEKENLFIILKVPFRHEGPGDRIPFSTVSLGIIVGPEWVILISRSPVGFIEEMIEKGTLSPKKKTRLVFQVLFRNAEIFLRSLEEINLALNETEERLHRSMRNAELERLMQIQKSLVYFATSLRSNQVMAERLRRSSVLVKYPEDEDLLEETLVEIHQASEMTGIYTNILSGMMDAYASVISNNLTIVMKILTVVTILMQVPVLITGFYGMNLPLPLQGFPFAYLVVIAWMVMASLVILFLFRFKRWV
jgi:magnesium transporter